MEAVASPSKQHLARHSQSSSEGSTSNFLVTSGAGAPPPYDHTAPGSHIAASHYSTAPGSHTSLDAPDSPLVRSAGGTHPPVPNLQVAAAAVPFSSNPPASPGAATAGHPSSPAGVPQAQGAASGGSASSAASGGPPIGRGQSRLQQLSNRLKINKAKVKAQAVATFSSIANAPSAMFGAASSLSSPASHSHSRSAPPAAALQPSAAALSHGQAPSQPLLASSPTAASGPLSSSSGANVASGAGAAHMHTAGSREVQGPASSNSLHSICGGGSASMLTASPAAAGSGGGVAQGVGGGMGGGAAGGGANGYTSSGSEQFSGHAPGPSSSQHQQHAKHPTSSPRGTTAAAADGPASDSAVAGAGGGSGGIQRSGGGNTVTFAPGAAEEFSPPSGSASQPINPMSYLTMPFTLPFKAMAKSRAGASVARYVGTIKHRHASKPPSGYMWLWMGHFKRWRKRFFVLPEAPGLLLIYQRSNLTGKVWSISLRGADATADPSHPLQIRLITTSGSIFLRVLHDGERDAWLASLRKSMEQFRKNQQLVDAVTGGNGGTEPGSTAAAAAGLLARPSVGLAAAMGSAGALGGPSPVITWVDLDQDQRRRVKARVNDRLCELQPLADEVQRCLGAAAGQLAGLAASLNITVGTSSALMPLAAQQSVAQQQQPGASHVMHASRSANQFSTTTSSSPIGSARPSQQQPAAAVAMPPAAGASGALPAAGTATGAAGTVGNASADSPQEASPGSVPLPSRPLLTAEHSMEGASGGGIGSGGPGGILAAGGSSGMHHPGIIRSRSRGRSAAASPHPLAPPAGPPGSLQAAVSALLEGFKATLLHEAVAIAQLQAENAALQKTVNLVRMANNRNSASRNQARATAAALASGAGTAGGRTGASSGVPSSSQHPFISVDGGDRGELLLDDDGVSIMTADEDAFDVVEAFDEGVDYSILDDDAHHLRLVGLTSTGGSAAAAAAAAAGGSGAAADEDSISGLGGGVGISGKAAAPRRSGSRVLRATTDEEEDDEEADSEDEVGTCIDDEEDEVTLQNHVQVMNALENVRQVEYVATTGQADKVTAILAVDQPPPPDEEPASGTTRTHHTGGSGAAGAEGRAEDDDDEDTDDEEDDDIDEEMDEAIKRMDSRAAASTAAGEVAAATVSAVSADAAAAQGHGHGHHHLQGPPPRERLPALKPLGLGFSIWSILKNMIGRDLTRITMPATINEPISLTQRLAEMLEYRRLLDKALEANTPIERLMWVTVFALANYNSQPLRNNKPFNPLLGETYEWRSRDGRYRYLSEQVSHHPPVSAFAAEGAGGAVQVYGEVETKTKFWGKFIELLMAGHVEVRLTGHGDVFRFGLATINVNDVILGRYWLDVVGETRVTNTCTGDYSIMNFKPCKGRNGEKGRVDCSVHNAQGELVYRIQGNVTDKLFMMATALAPGGATSGAPVQVWAKEPGVPDQEQQYYMPKFAIALNDPADPIVPILPPTDVRFRPDLRALEQGEWQRATSEKLRLEEKQRGARKVRAAAGEEYRPKWFDARGVAPNGRDLTMPPEARGSCWAFNGTYWAKQAAKDWQGVPDIF